METLESAASGIGALALGQLIGYLSESGTTAIWQARSTTTIDSLEGNSVFDYALDALTEAVFLLIGVNLAGKAMPSLNTDLHNLIFFLMGLFFSVGRLPADLRSIRAKLSSVPAATVEITE